jgi:MSHA biogenesis protein MshO
MRRKFKQPRLAMSGFTLVELVIVIVVMAILGGISVSFIKNSVLAYVNSEAYYELADRADISLSRMSRDIRNALPNSVWVPGGSGSYVQFVPIKAGGRYQQEDFDAGSLTLDVLGPMVNVDAGDKLVIYNMGIAGADVYEGSNIRPVSANASSVTFTGALFPFASPGGRFYVVNTAVIYACDLPNRRLVMYSNVDISAGLAPNFNGLTANVVAEDVTDCSFTYTPGVMQHSSVVTAQLTLAKNGGVARLVNLINVVNSP